jgi:hypothetical protein
MDSNIHTVPEIFSFLLQTLETYVLHSNARRSWSTSVLVLKKIILPTHKQFFSGPDQDGKLFVTCKPDGDI